MTSPINPAPPVHILILAAGAGLRMRGGDKLLEPVGGQPLLRHLASEALATGRPVTVTLPPGRPERAAALHGLPVQTVQAGDAASGMANSLRAGLASIAPQAAVLVLLADMPDISAKDLMRMIDQQITAPELILRGTAADGTPGHPVLFPPWARGALEQVRGDQGARDVLRAHADRVRHVALPGRHATTDLDTPEEWAAWRSGRE